MLLHQNGNRVERSMNEVKAKVFFAYLHDITPHQGSGGWHIDVAPVVGGGAGFVGFMRISLSI